MRRKKYIWAVAGALSLMQCISAYAGTWTQETWGETKKWIYTNDDGSTADYEWVKDNGDWYYCGRCAPRSRAAASERVQPARRS